MVAPQTPAESCAASRVLELGVPLILYIKTDKYVPADGVGRLTEQGAVFGIKYAVPRTDPTQDPYLEALIASRR